MLIYFSVLFADIIFCMKDKQAIEIPKPMLNVDFMTAQPPPNLGGEWYAVVLITKLSVVNETNKLTGSVLSKLRHLELLGYKTIQVHGFTHRLSFFHLCINVNVFISWSLPSKKKPLTNRFDRKKIILN